MFQLGKGAGGEILEAWICFTCRRNSKKADVAGAEWASRRQVGGTVGRAGLEPAGGKARRKFMWVSQAILRTLAFILSERGFELHDLPQVLLGSLWQRWEHSLVTLPVNPTPYPRRGCNMTLFRWWSRVGGCKRATSVHVTKPPLPCCLSQSWDTNDSSGAFGWKFF